MKTTIILIVLILVTFSCKKENGSFISKYQTIYGTWKTQAISYDSSGIKVTISTRYDRLIINGDLTYKVYRDSDNLIENGTVNIISQNNDNLEIYFDAKYPIYSSFAGSHLFVETNSVKLISLTSELLILKSFDIGYYHYPEFYFKR